MALFNYDDLLNKSNKSTTASSNFSYDYLVENSMFKSEGAIDVNDYKEFDIFYLIVIVIEKLYLD